jgi:hypothetical protein
MSRPTTTSLGFALGTRAMGSPILPALSGTKKVLGLGNSVMYGYGVGAGPSFRAALKTRLADIGVVVDYVGPLSDGVSADPQHWGVPGARISDFVAGNTVGGLSCDLSTMGATYTPDVIIVELGLNDWNADSDGLTDLASLMGILWTQRPTARVAVLKCFHLNLNAKLAPWTTFMAGVDTVVAASQHGAAGRALTVDVSRVAISMINTGVRSSELFDIAHPTPLTFAKLVDLMWPGVCNVFGYDAQW